MKRKPRPKTKAVMSFRPSAGIQKAIETLATRERRSVSQIIHHLVEEALSARSGRQPDRRD